MIELLAKWFIPDYKNISDPKVRAAFGTLCSVTAIVFNVLLFGAKFTVGRLAGSVSITADAVNNLTDAGSAILIFLGFLLANRKPSPDRPFGHGRIEYVAGFVVAAIILVAAVELGRGSVEKLFAPEEIEFSWVAAVVLAAAIAVKVYMAAFTKKIAEKIDSSAMRAAAADYKSDSLSTLVALACMLLYRFAGWNVDAWGGLVVSLFIFKTGIEAAGETLGQLMGRKPSPALVSRVEEIVLSFPEVIGIHDLIIHDYGPGRLMISLHAEVDGSGNVYDLHDAMDRAMMALDVKLGCESVIHMDPVDIKNELASRLRDETAALVHGIDPALSIHDFRVVPGRTHTNLIFDVLVPQDFRLPDQELRGVISAAVKEKHPDHFCAIKVDKSYI